MRYNNYFSLQSLQPILPFLWMFSFWNWVTSKVMKVIKLEHQKKKKKKKKKWGGGGI